MEQEDKAFAWHIIFLAVCFGAMAASWYYDQRQIPLVTWQYSNGDTVTVPAGTTAADVAEIVKRHKNEQPEQTTVGSYSLI